MWYAPSVIDPPAAEPLTVEEVKARLRVDSGDGDDDLAAMIMETRDHVEKYCNIVLSRRDLALKCDEFGDFARLPVAPAAEVLAVVYQDAAGVERTLDASVYEGAFGEFEGAIILKPGQAWPVIQPGSRIELRLRVGYETLPGAVRHAMLVYIGEADKRRANDAVPGWTAFDSKLANYRRGS